MLQAYVRHSLTVTVCQVFSAPVVWGHPVRSTVGFPISGTPSVSSVFEFWGTSDTGFSE